MDTLSHSLTKLMRDQGLTMRELSLKAGKGETFVRDIINGKSSSPTVASLTLLAKALGVTVPSLLGDKTATPSPDLEIMGACMLWVLQNGESLAFLSHEQIVEQLMRQYSRMLSDRINDKAEAVRITRYLFENMQDQKLLKKPTAKTSPRRTAKKS